MVERRKPLVLSSTRALLDSLLSSAKSHGIGSDGADDAAAQNRGGAGQGGPVRLHAGIIRFTDGVESDDMTDNSFMVGVSASVLKRLSITSGSLVLLKNPETNVGRIAKAKVIDHPLAGDTDGESTTQAISVSCPPRVMNLLPSLAYQSDDRSPLDQEVAYATPLLAFNLGLHITCLKLLVHGGQDSLMPLFNVEGHKQEKEMGYPPPCVDLFPWTDMPKYASHLRISFVKIPECGLLGSIKGKSAIEEGDRQDMIDSALNEYFRVDRFLARGDVFYVSIDWNCNSELCVFCNKKVPKGLYANIIYFKVMSMEPLNEPILRVNCNQTALVLGGSTASAIPPDRLIGSADEFTPLHNETVKTLASILAPALCPSALLSKFRVAVFLYGNTGCGKRTVVRYIAKCLGLHVVEYSCHDLIESSERKPSAALTNAFKAASRYSPSLLLLRHFDLFANLSSNEASLSDQVGITSEVATVIREFTDPIPGSEDLYQRKTMNDASFLVEAENLNSHRVFLVAAASSSEGMQPQIRRCFSHEISMSPLSEGQRVSMLSQLLKGLTKVVDKTIDDEFLKDVTSQTSGFMPRDIQALVADASASFVHRSLFDSSKVECSECHDISVTGHESIQDENGSHVYAAKYLEQRDFLKALERSKKRNASALGTPKVPNVKWEDVGGLEEVKKSILDTVQLPLLHKDLFSSGLRKRSGVLLYGPPGTGKTLLAKAVATECSLNFLSVKGPELINMYIGESEKNVRDIFQKARGARPCVIFFDELDSLAPARGASGDSGGVMDRVVSQMLAEIDGLNDSSQDLFIIGASNRPDLIDPALLRPGRFDKLLYVGVNTDASYRERVLKALTRRFKLHENVSLFSVAKKCPPNFTGADMYALCADAWFHAAKRKMSGDCLGSSSSDDKADSVTVEINDFMKVLGDLSPSLSMDELMKYERLREQFEGGPK
ncbi:peroxisome biogenesis protein 6 [Canna indica]|uniref:Peroxisomal ATPase PEX6 n=1 Tax=Canna indica TaxID=4628 RepID=A0AAQ3KV14_9LILI|nr:peroxisome biogenesis protein 6 [Canna indica]